MGFVNLLVDPFAVFHVYLLAGEKIEARLVGELLSHLPCNSKSVRATTLMNLCAGLYVYQGELSQPQHITTIPFFSIAIQPFHYVHTPTMPSPCSFNLFHQVRSPVPPPLLSTLFNELFPPSLTFYQPAIPFPHPFNHSHQVRLPAVPSLPSI